MNQNNFREFFLFKNTFGKENTKILFWGAIVFCIPIIFSEQLIAGTIVNLLLIKSAFDYKTKKVFLLALVPSTATFLTGFIFGSLTEQLLLLIPFIWMGNLVLMFFTRKVFEKKKNRNNVSKKLFFIPVIKTALLFVSTVVLFAFGLVPLAFLTIFGAIQLFTGEAGAIIFTFLQIRKK